jgi:hypothetical protein
LAAIGGLMVLGLQACEKKGPVEKAGEKVDHVIDSAKDGGKEVGDKLEDAAGHVKDAVDDVKK